MESTLVREAEEAALVTEQAIAAGLDIDRLIIARAAVEAGFYNEGI